MLLFAKLETTINYQYGIGPPFVATIQHQFVLGMRDTSPAQEARRTLNHSSSRTVQFTMMQVEENVFCVAPLKYHKVAQKYLDLVTWSQSEMFNECSSNHSATSLVLVHYHADTWHPLFGTVFVPLGAHGLVVLGSDVPIKHSRECNDIAAQTSLIHPVLHSGQ